MVQTSPDQRKDRGIFTCTKEKKKTIYRYVLAFKTRQHGRNLSGVWQYQFIHLLLSKRLHKIYKQSRCHDTQVSNSIMVSPYFILIRSL